MPLTVQEYNKMTKEITPSNSSKMLATKGLSNGQKTQLRKLLQEKKVQMQLVPYVQRTGQERNFNESMKKAMAAARSSGRIASARAVASSPKSADSALVSSNPLTTDRYNRHFEATGGRGLPPKPYFPATQTETRAVFARGRTGVRTMTLGPGATVAVMVTPYQTVAATIMDPNVSPFTNFAYVTNTNRTFTATHAEWQRDPLLTTLDNSFVDPTPGNIDVFGKQALVPDASIESYDGALPFAQLVGGELGVQLAVPYDGAAVLHVLGYDDNPTVVGSRAHRNFVRRTGVGSDLMAAITLPQETNNGSLTSLAQIFGRTSVLTGSSPSAKKSVCLRLPQDRGWYHPHLPKVMVGGDGATSYSWDRGFAPAANGIWNSQFGYVIATNTSATANATLSFGSHQTYCVTWPDMFSSAISAPDILRTQTLQNSIKLSSHQHAGGLSSTQSIIEEGKDINEHLAGKTSEMIHGHHLMDNISTGVTVASAAQMLANNNRFANSFPKIARVINGTSEFIERGAVAGFNLAKSAIRKAPAIVGDVLAGLSII